MQSAREIAPPALVSQALGAALAGAKAARAAQAAGLNARQKSHDKDDLVTEGDKAAQEAVLALLPRTHAGEPIGVLAEEQTESVYDAPQARLRWVIDPIDGTLPYSRGEPYWCVSIALQEMAEHWESRIGVLYQASPQDTAEKLYGRLLWAEPGKGAFVQQLPDGAHRALARPGPIAPAAELSAGGAFGAWVEAEFRRLGIAAQFRRSICHAVCEMLMGEKCAVVQDAGPLEWDVAAAGLIAREAGAHVHIVRAEPAPACDRYAVVMAWDKALFDRIRARLY